MTAYSGYSSDWLTDLQAVGTKILNNAHAAVFAEGVQVNHCLQDNFQGAVHDIVSAEASSWPADLIVVGTQGRRGVRRLVMGSSVEHIARLSPVPALLVRNPTPRVYRENMMEALASGAHLPVGTLAMG